MIGAKHFALLVLVVLIAFAPSVLQQADAQNVPPTAQGKASPSNPAPGVKVTLTGSGTDANGDALTFTWTLSDAPPGNMATIMNADKQIDFIARYCKGRLNIQTKFG